MKYFMMSKKFNKRTYEDFGLKIIDEKFIRQEDMSEWEPCFLFDFGWGAENGFYRKPLGDFTFLLKIVFSDDEEDSYGATAIILNKYPFELKLFLKDEILVKQKEYDLQRLEKVFNLTNPINRTIKPSMSIYEIEEEMNDWMLISKYFIQKL